VSTQVPAPPWQHRPKREEPDASAYAVPGGIGYIPVCVSASDCIWSAEGGTSAAATVLGAVGVLFSEQYGVDGQPDRWGNFAGAFWRFGRRATSIADITAGANTTFTSTCCSAEPGYDTASGWGLADADHVQQSILRSTS
jgi:hypothetical protein